MKSKAGDIVVSAPYTCECGEVKIIGQRLNDVPEDTSHGFDLDICRKCFALSRTGEDGKRRPLTADDIELMKKNGFEWFRLQAIIGILKAKRDPNNDERRLFK